MDSPVSGRFGTGLPAGLRIVWPVVSVLLALMAGLGLAVAAVARQERHRTVRPFLRPLFDRPQWCPPTQVETRSRRSARAGRTLHLFQGEENGMSNDRSKGMLKCGLAALAAAACVFLLPVGPAVAADGKTPAAQLNSQANSALQQLYAKVPAAKTLGQKATAILVFPKVTKAGLGVGGQYGEGALLKGGKAVGYYSTAGASYGLQAGVQTYGYAMFFMNEAALKSLDSAQGFEVGIGPSVVVMDEGKAKTTTTTTMKDDIYAFIFSQKGLMAGLGLQGNKITKITPK